MDINATLHDIRNLVLKTEDVQNDVQLTESDMDAALASIAVDLAEKVAAMDEWMSNGGFTPYEWK